MMRTALVLDADSPAGLEALQSLGRKGLATHAASPDDCLAFRSRRVSRRWKQPISEPTAFLRWLRDLDAEHAYALIVPSTERSLRMLLSLPDDDALVAKAVLAPRASLETALDKWATAELALSCGVPALPTRLLTSLSDLAGARSFPVVLKTLRSVVDMDGELTHVPARLARDAEERQRFCELFLPHTPVIEQTYERGHGVGIELLYDRGRRIWHFCHERLHEGTGQEGLGSGSLYRRSAVAPPDLLHYATAMLDRLSWHGVAMVEFLVAPTGESWLMEINPRLWGSVALPIDAGVDFPAGLLLLATAQAVPPQPGYRVPYYTRRAPEDSVWLLGKARSRPAWVLRELLLMSRLLTGRESWDHFDWGDLAVTVAGWGRASKAMTKAVGRRLRERLEWRRARRRHRQNLGAARRRPVRTALFLCHGNICRSPVAGSLAQQRLQGWAISSAGFITEAGRPSPSCLQEAARLLDLDLSTWRSLRVSRQMVESADVVFLMDMRNLRAFQEEFPDALGKVLFLGMFLPEPAEIADPYGQDVERTVVVLRDIQAAIERVAALFSTRRTGVST